MIDMPTIVIGKYVLRTILKSDYLDYYEIGKDLENVKYVSWGPFDNPMQAMWVFENIFWKREEMDLPIGYAICLKSTNRMIGVIDFHTRYKEINAAEIGYIIHRDYWNQGICSMCLKEMIRVGFEYLEYDKIIIGHVRENLASMHVIIKNGFKYEEMKYGYFKDRENIIHDCIMYSLYRNEYYNEKRR